MGPASLQKLAQSGRIFREPNFFRDSRGILHFSKMAPRSRLLALGLLPLLLLLAGADAAAAPTKGAETLQRRVLSPPLANGGGFCGDGSPAQYYYAPPPAGSDLAKTWIIYLEGGAMCFTAEGCEKRLTDPILAKSFPLTAKGSPAELASAKAGTGDLLSNDPAHSPFALAHRVHVTYCTQDAHLGGVVKPNNATFGVHFDGHLNLQGIIDDLASDGIEGAERVLLFGMSAGGIGVFGNVDWLQERLPNAAVKGAPAAGFVAPTGPGTSGPFLEPVADYASFVVGGDAGSAADIWAIADIWNVTAALPPVARAVAALGDDWDFSMNQLYPFVEAPLYMLQAMYDRACPPSRPGTDGFPDSPPPFPPAPLAQCCRPATWASRRATTSARRRTPSTTPRLPPGSRTTATRRATRSPGRATSPRRRTRPPRSTP